MAGTTIHSLAYIVTANTEQFEKGMIATRQELRASKKMMEESVPAIRQFEMAMQNVDKMFAKGLIDKRAHTAAVTRLKNEYGQMSTSAKLLADSSDKFGQVIRGWGAAAVGVFSVSKAIGAIKQEFEDIDRTLEVSEKLGVAIDDLMRIRGVAEIAGGASADAVDAAFSKLNRNLKELREGSEGALALFEQIGLTAQDLEGMDLGQAMLKVADGIAMIEGADKQLAITQEILGKGAGDLANMMKMGADEIERMGAGIPAVNQIDAEKIAKAKDAMDKIDRLLTSIAQNLAISVAPAIQAVAESIDYYFGRDDYRVRSVMDKTIAGPSNMAGSDYLQKQFMDTPTQFDDRQFVSFMNIAARMNPNFSMASASQESSTFAGLNSQLKTQTQRLLAGTIGNSQYEQEVKQIFQAMFMELMRMREAQEQANNQKQSEGAKIE